MLVCQRRAAACEALGDTALKELVTQGMARAEHYGIGPVVDVAHFIELMLDWGSDFDTSNRTPWAAPILDWRAGTGTAKLVMLDRAAAAARQATKRP